MGSTRGVHRGGLGTQKGSGGSTGPRPYLGFAGGKLGFYEISVKFVSKASPRLRTKRNVMQIHRIVIDEVALRRQVPPPLCKFLRESYDSRRAAPSAQVANVVPRIVQDAILDIHLAFFFALGPSRHSFTATVLCETSWVGRLWVQLPRFDQKIINVQASCPTPVLRNYQRHCFC